MSSESAASAVRIEELKEQLEEERNKPVPVAVEYKTDEAELKKAAEVARQKTVSEYETKLKKAEQNRKTAEQKQTEAERKYRSLEQERETQTEQLKWGNSKGDNVERAYVTYIEKPILQLESLTAYQHAITLRDYRQIIEDDPEMM